jgi:hypothetical protein
MKSGPPPTRSPHLGSLRLWLVVRTVARVHDLELDLSDEGGNRAEDSEQRHCQNHRAASNGANRQGHFQNNAAIRLDQPDAADLPFGRKAFDAGHKFAACNLDLFSPCPLWLVFCMRGFDLSAPDSELLYSIFQSPILGKLKIMEAGDWRP